MNAHLVDSGVLMGLSDLRLGDRASDAKVSYHEPLGSGKTCRSDPSDRYSVLFGDKASVGVESL